MAREIQPSKEAGESDLKGSKKAVRLGIALGKNSIPLRGVDEPVRKKPERRSALLREEAKLARSLIGMAACGGAHHWAREISEHGHEEQLMAAQIVKSNQSDYRDFAGVRQRLRR